MNEYWLMLCFVGLGAAFALAFFRQLARLAIWSNRPTLDAWRYGLITACMAIVIGNAFEVWEAALMGAVSLIAYSAIRRDKTRLDQICKAHSQSLSEVRLYDYRSGHKS